MKRTLVTVLKLVFIGACFWLIFHRVPWLAVAGRVRSAAPLWLLAAFATVLAEPVVMAVKWRLLLRTQGRPIALWRVIRVVFASNFLSVAIPVSVGADALRIWMMRAEQFSLAQAAGSLVADRVLGIVALMGLSVAATIGLGTQLAGTGIPQAIAVIAGIMLTLIGLLLSPLPAWVAPRVRQALARHVAPRARTAGAALDQALRRLEEIHAALVDFARHPRTLAAVLALNLSVQLLRVAGFHCLFHALHQVVPWTRELAFVPMIVFLTLLPVSYFGLGVKESAFLYFFGRAGVPGPVCLGVSILTYPLIFAALLPGAALALGRLKGRQPIAPPRRE